MLFRSPGPKPRYNTLLPTQPTMRGHPPTSRTPHLRQRTGSRIWAYHKLIIILHFVRPGCAPRQTSRIVIVARARYPLSQWKMLRRLAFRVAPQCGYIIPAQHRQYYLSIMFDTFFRLVHALYVSIVSYHIIATFRSNINDRMYL